VKKLLPILLIVVSLVGGLAVGSVMKPKPEPCTPDPEQGIACPEEVAEEPEEDPAAPTEFVDLDRQFVVPIMKGEEMRGLVVASLAIEVLEGQSDTVTGREPKLRDAFLQVMFVHAHSGGFDGEFTKREAMDDLRGRLREVAEPIVGDSFREVLLTDIVRQDF